MRRATANTIAGLLAAAVVLCCATAASAYNWSSYGYVNQVYVRSNGETTFNFSGTPACGGTYYRVSANHAAKDRMFTLLHAAWLNGIRVSIDANCDGVVGTVKTEGLN